MCHMPFMYTTQDSEEILFRQYGRDSSNVAPGHHDISNKIGNVQSYISIYQRFATEDAEAFYKEVLEPMMKQ